jgi:hypothetical protein
MPSSTSASSARRPAARAAAILIAGCVAIVAFSEGIARLGFDRVSRIQRRTSSEYRGAIAPRDRQAQHGVLFVGNSLLDEGVQFDTLRQRLAPEWDARRFVVEQTYYNDWYYGLRRLFHEGARPDVVVIVLTSRQWTRDDTRGDYSAQYLMTVPDAASAAMALHMHPTQASSFMLASVSRFWGVRAEIRNVLLGRVIPDLGRLMNFSSVVDRNPIRDDSVERIAADRFGRCRDLAAAYGVTVAALIPPVLNPSDGSGGLVRAGQRTGVRVFAPVASGAYPRGFYRDAGFHLNATGARAFTNALAAYLPTHLAAVARHTTMTVASR